jgi:hypothetical protein
MSQNSFSDLCQQPKRCQAAVVRLDNFAVQLLQ